MAVNFPDLGFSEPEEWFHENSEDIEATIKLVRVFKKIIETGSKLECIDAWAHDPSDPPNLSGNVIVNFSQVSETAFRLIENYHHEFTSQNLTITSNGTAKRCAFVSPVVGVKCL